jgi:hypothetical protein
MGRKINWLLYMSSPCVGDTNGGPMGALELVVITKTYDLILCSCNHTGKFPRNHHFVPGERVERNLYDLLEFRVPTQYTLWR